MALVQNPDTGQWEWDYSNGGPPNSQAPWDPATGQNLGAPPDASWDPANGGWVTAPTASGNDPTAPTPPTPPTPPPGAPNPPPNGLTSPSGQPSNGIGTWGPQFMAPVWQRPADFTYADFQKPADYTPGTFSLPTLAEAQNAPGYQFAAQEGQKALEGSKAAQGVYRTGGTLKDLYSWTNKFAEQNYGNVVNQNLAAFNTNEGNAASAYKTNLQGAEDAYGLNRGNAASNWTMNYGASRDAFDRNYQGALDEFAPKQDYARLDFARQWSDFLSKLDLQKTILNNGNA